MRHHSKYIPFGIANTGNMVNGAVKISFGAQIALCIAITKQDLLIILKLFKAIVINKVVALPVGYRKVEHLAFLQVACKHGIGGFAADKYIFADKLKRLIVQHGPWN